MKHIVFKWWPLSDIEYFSNYYKLWFIYLFNYFVLKNKCPDCSDAADDVRGNLSCEILLIKSTKFPF